MPRRSVSVTNSTETLSMIRLPRDWSRTTRTTLLFGITLSAPTRLESVALGWCPRRAVEVPQAIIRVTPLMLQMTLYTHSQGRNGLGNMTTSPQTSNKSRPSRRQQRRTSSTTLNWIRGRLPSKSNRCRPMAPLITESKMPPRCPRQSTAISKGEQAMTKMDGSMTISIRF